MEIVFDLEADGLDPTKIYCLSYSASDGEVKTLTDYDEMRKLFNEATCIIGHNIRRFDIPVVERLLSTSITCRVIDTLALAWYLEPQRPKYGLATYGDQFGVAKPVVEDWHTLDLDVYIHRCEEDVKINSHLWNWQWNKLLRIYGEENKDTVWKFLEYLDFKMLCAQKQERDKWKLDVEYASKALEDLKREKDEKVKVLAGLMPKVPKYATKTKPKNMSKKDGSPTIACLNWISLTSEELVPFDTEEVTYIHHFDEPNPSSNQQIKDWLTSLGWKPRTFKHKDGRQIPQINQEFGKGICESIKDLFSEQPALSVLDGLAILSHRIPILEGFLRTVDSEGYVRARVQGVTNTLRFRHSHPCVNLPKPDRPYAEAIRASLVAPSGYELCGADMASLEDRLKQHFIYPLDPEYVKTMMQDDFDPHLDLAVLGGGLTQEEADAYKKGDKSKKRVRDIFKNGNYACQYGAGAARLVLTCGIELKEAKALHATYWERNWAIRAVCKKQTIRRINDDTEMWLLNPVSGFYYSLRSEKDIFSTLVQGTAAYVFDRWVSYVLKVKDQLTAQFHDEIVQCVKKGYREQIVVALNKTIDLANKEFKLNRELGIGIQFGDRYSEIH